MSFIPAWGWERDRTCVLHIPFEAEISQPKGAERSFYASFGYATQHAKCKRIDIIRKGEKHYLNVDSSEAEFEVLSIQDIKKEGPPLYKEPGVYIECKMPVGELPISFYLSC